METCCAFPLHTSVAPIVEIFSQGLGFGSSVPAGRISCAQFSVPYAPRCQILLAKYFKAFENR